VEVWGAAGRLRSQQESESASREPVTDESSEDCESPLDQTEAEEEEAEEAMDEL
jgi:hypothetical protein